MEWFKNGWIRITTRSCSTFTVNFFISKQDFICCKGRKNRREKWHKRISWVSPSKFLTILVFFTNSFSYSLFSHFWYVIRKCRQKKKRKKRKLRKTKQKISHASVNAYTEQMRKNSYKKHHSIGTAQQWKQLFSDILIFRSNCQKWCWEFKNRRWQQNKVSKARSKQKRGKSGKVGFLD